MIIDTFNPVFWGFFAVCLALWFVFYMVLRHKDERVKRIATATLYFVVIALFIIYKVGISLDKQYISDFKVDGVFSWFTELPFNHCNICMIFIPIAILSKNRILQSYCFFFGFFFGFMAMLTPEQGFAGYSVFLGRNLGFYFTHFMIMLAPFFLLSLGLYVPTWKDILYNLLVLALITCALHGINAILRVTGAYPTANYGFTMEAFEGSILEMLYKFTPIRFVYLFPGGALIIGTYSLIVTGLVKLCRLPFGKKENVESNG